MKEKWEERLEKVLTKGSSLTEIEECVRDEIRIAYERGLRHARERIQKPDIKGFDDFYEMYPRKVGKALAKKHWERLAPDATLREKIALNLSKRIKGEWKEIKKEYIPHPGTYINNERWEDEVDEPKTKSKLTW